MKLPALRYLVNDCDCNRTSPIKNRREYFTRDEQRILYHALVSDYETMDKETRKTAKFLIREMFV
jgi:hypothetical protein